ncbi:MAG: hypothetical protein KME63_09420 [Candidatus Thiodiazotropha sp. (ex Clathrolucina costata)]|nr:hypothetical protein [Candidatus Thiodiazotropha taylori]MCG7864302.1 hypothetical protein [Candidatus Thiodiazotropha endolucinida]
MENLIAYIFIALVVGVFGYIEFTRGPAPYRGRSCTGRAWKKAFPTYSKENIRLFLLCLVDGMALSDKTKLKFHPNDQAIDVYRSLYGGKTPIGDNLELETFFENLVNGFKVEESSLQKVWHENITLGELYEFVSA